MDHLKNHSLFGLGLPGIYIYNITPPAAKRMMSFFVINMTIIGCDNLPFWRHLKIDGDKMYSLLKVRPFSGSTFVTSWGGVMIHWLNP